MQDRSLWTWHMMAGVVILVLLGLHMAIMHLDSALGIFNPAGGHPIDWDNVLERGKSVFFAVTYIVLLGALSTFLDVPVATWEKVIKKRVPQKFVDLNLKAFDAGRSLLGS